MSSGQIVQIIGAVIDVEFSRDQVPRSEEHTSELQSPR